MQHEMTGYWRMVSSARRPLVGALAALLLLPLGVGAVKSGGDLDPGFGGDGTVLTEFGSGSRSQANALILQPNGKIVVAGVSNVLGSSAFALVRYRSKGTLDPTFGSDGMVLTDFGSDRVSVANALALQADRKIVVAGVSFSNVSRHDDFALVRYQSDGTLDATFGSAGMVLTDFEGGSLDFAYALAMQADGKIVVAGNSYSLARGSYDFALARYLSDGTLDAAFGSNGMVLTDFEGGQDGVSALALQADGKIVVTGSSTATGGFILARYLPDGALDAAFGSAGTVLTHFGGSSDDQAYALAQQVDGKMVVAGFSNAGGSYDFALARYLSDGTLDATFGNAGTVLTDFQGGSFDGAHALALQADGKMAVAGYSTAGGSGDFALVRYLPNGTLDATFSSDGKITTDFGYDDRAIALAIQPPKRRIVVAGFPSDDDRGPIAFALAGYNVK